MGGGGVGVRGDSKRGRDRYVACFPNPSTLLTARARVRYGRNMYPY
jgi:hypothetical protein